VEVITTQNGMELSNSSEIVRSLQVDASKLGDVRHEIGSCRVDGGHGKALAIGTL